MKKDKKIVHVSLRLSEERRRQLQELSEVAGVSSSSLIRMAVDSLVLSLYDEDGMVKDEFIKRANKARDNMP